MKPPFLALFSAGLLLVQCHKKHDPSPLEQLPPATQIGANTFGCLLNGKAWVPDGSDGNHGSNLSVSYDVPSTSRDGEGGTFDLRTYRYTKDTDQYMNLFARKLKLGTHYFTDRFDTRAMLNDGKTGCYYDSYTRSSATFISGKLTITTLSTSKAVIAGTFEFTLVVPGCDTLRVTEGRFDKKI